MKSEQQRNRFMLACFICILIPLLIGYLSYYETCKLLKEDALNQNEVVLYNAVKQSELQYESLNMLCQQLYSSISGSQLLHSQNISPSRIQVKKLEVIGDLAKYIQSSDEVSAYYVYLKPISTVITEESAYSDIRLFYDKNVTGDPNNYDMWLSNISRPHRSLMARRETYLSKLPFQNGVTFYCSFPFKPYGDSQGCIVLVVNEEKLRTPFEALSENGISYSVTDEEGGLLFSALNYPIGNIELNADGSSTLRDAKNEYFIISAHSDITGWHYKIATNTTSLYASLAFYRKLYITTSLIVLALGIFISIQMVLRAMKPVKQLIARNSSMEKMLSRQSTFMSTSFWQKLISGELANVDDLGDMMELAGIKCRGDRYAAILLQFNSQLSQDDMRSIEKATGCENNAYSLKPSEVLLCVPLINGGASIVSMGKSLLNSMSISKRILRAGCGNPCNDLTQFYQSYYQAETALVYARSNDLTLAQCPEDRKPFSKLLPVNTYADQIVRTVKAGQTETLSEYLKQIREKCFGEAQTDFFIKLQIIYEMRHIIIRCMGIIEDEHGLDNELLSSIIRANTQVNISNVDQEFDNLQSTLTAICAIREKGSGAEIYNNRIEEMKLYIRENHTNPDMSLRIVAEHFNMNETYLSSYFGQNGHVSFLDYLQQVRIDHAIEMIKDGKDSLSVIAKDVGYINDQTFRRAFKRVVGVSPAVFRETFFNSQ